MDTDTGHGHDQNRDIFVTAEEAARIAGVSARTVRRWINAGDIQAAEGERGRVVSLSDVRRRAVSGHDRTRPSSEQIRSRTTPDMDTSAVVSAMSESASLQMVAIAEQIERLTREAMQAIQRAEVAEQETQSERAGRIAAESKVEELTALVEILRAIPHNQEPEPEHATMPVESPPEATSEELPVSMSQDTLHERSRFSDLWRRVRGRSG